jgi:hypothetical protein
MTTRVFASPEEAAHIFDTTPQTIRAWIAAGKLRTAPRLGRKHLIYVESIAEQAGISVERVNQIIDTLERRTRGDTINEPGAVISVVGVATH